jgi:MinD-like ATPase involved in chromosome partitioning or flagellar assembly
VDLPTYTNIWRIEKRLYKLYDLRLPMPLPIVWIGVFVGVFVPWSLLLVLVGVPVQMPWHVLFLVPPGIVTWLSTRPVIEGKRLTELLESQLRYLGQPKAWYRLAPTSEPEAVTFSGRVWRTAPARAKIKAPRKSRQPQRKREGQRITGPRQVRPAVAAAAVAAGQAPVAEPATGRSGWGSRRGAAPALSGQVRQSAAASAPETVKQPVPREEGLSGGPERRQELPLVVVPRMPGDRADGGDHGNRADVVKRADRRDGADRGDRAAGADRREGAAGVGSAAEPAERVPAARGETRTGKNRGAGGRRDAGREAVEERAAAHGVAGRDDADHESTDHESGGREFADHESADHESADHEFADHESVGRESAGRASGDYESAGRKSAGRASGDYESAGRESADYEVTGREAAGREAGDGTPVVGQFAGEAEGVPESEGERGASAEVEAAGGPGAVVPIRTGEGRRSGAGKPIDTEALRRLRKLAASADAPAEAAAEGRAEGGAGERRESERRESERREGGRRGDGRHGGGRREDEVARDQHRKGQPPRLGPALVLSGTQRVWPPLNPNAKPLPRPATPRGERDEAASTRGTTADAGDPGKGRPAQQGDAPAGAVPHGPAAMEEAPGRQREPKSGQGAPQAGDAERTDGQGESKGAASQGPGAVGDSSQRAGSRGLRAVGDAQEDTTPPRTSVAGDEPAGRRTPAAGTSAAGFDSARRFDEGAAQGAEDDDWDAEEGGEEAGELVVPVPRPGEGRVRRVESVVGRDSGGWRRIAQVVVGGGGVRTDGSEIDEARARGVFQGSRRVVVLGCTGGAGQSTTALMLGHTFAQYRDDRVVAVDANTGGATLTSKIEPETPETLTSLLSGLDRVSGYLTMRGYTTRTTSGLEVISADTDAGAEQRLADRSYFSDHRLGESMRLLDRHYKLAVIDPAAALAARVLPYADQLVLVVPASEEASEAVAMTYEWLDGHGCAELRRRAVMVVNGVSRRSMADVEQAESVASGRCRAIVRVPWEDDLAPGGAEVVDLGQLRAAGRRAYLALAGVVVAGFAAQTVRPSEEELASDPPGTRIGER